MQINLSLLVSTAFATLVATGAAQAQSVGSEPTGPAVGVAEDNVAASEALPAATSDETAGSSEILVTARRVEERLARVPASVTAFGNEELQQRGIVQQSDLQAAVPGLIVRETQSNNQLNYSIRGQTVDAFSGSSTAVVPYVNEVPFIAGGVSSFFDLQSIQVVKGPQGTLFGRNATGGAVLSTTVAPTNELEGFIKGSYGNYDAIDVEATLNIPLVEDKILFRATAKIQRRDGYIRNVFSGPVYGGNDNSRLGALHSNAFRGSLLIRPADVIENQTVVQYERTRGNNSGTQPYSINLCGQTGPDGSPLNCAAHSLYGEAQFNTIFGPGAWDQFLAAHPGANPGGIVGSLDRQQNQLGHWEVDDDAPSFHRGKDWFVTNTTKVELGENTVLKNIVGVTYSRAIDSTGQQGETLPIQTNYDASRPIGITEPRSYGNEVKNESFSEELQLQGSLFNEGVDYILGGYYQRIKNKTEFPQSYFDLTPFVPFTTTTSHFKSRDTTTALFGHAALDLGELAGLTGLKINAGGRYAWEKITLDHLPGGTYFGLTTSDFKDDRASWNLGLEYQATPDLMLYLVSRESWRSGGINGVAVPNDDKFKSEVARDVEGGLKFSGRLGDAPARLFLSGYIMEVKNIQRALFPVHPLFNSAVAVTVNVPKARIKGLELEAAIRPTPWLDLGVTGAYTNAKFTQNAVTVFPTTRPQSFQFGPFADTPKWSGSAYAVVTVPVDEALGSMRLRGDVYAQSHFYFSNTDDTVTPGTRLPGYKVVNLRFDRSEIAGSGFGVGAFVKNLTKEKYYVGGLPLGISLGINSANVGRPRMYGVEASCRF